MGSIRWSACLGMVALAAGCAQGGDEPAEAASCSARTSPDTPECRGCLGSPEDLIAPTPYSASSPFQDPNVTNQITITLETLSFAVVGDTRPAIVDDTAGYPTAIITQIFQDLENANPRPGFAVATGDYQVSSSSGAQAGPQLEKYLGARASPASSPRPRGRRASSRSRSTGSPSALRSFSRHWCSRAAAARRRACSSSVHSARRSARGPAESLDCW